MAFQSHYFEMETHLKVLLFNDSFYVYFQFFWFFLFLYIAYLFRKVVENRLRPDKFPFSVLEDG